MSSFNASILFNESLNNQIANLAMDLAIRSVMECSRKYGFDGEEAVRELGLGNNLLQLQVDTVVDNETETEEASELVEVPVNNNNNKPKKSKIVLSLSKREPPVKKVKEVVVKPPFPLPYNGTINEGSCLGLKNNHCLFTQCELKRVVNSDYCKTCLAQSEKNSNGKPDYGTITDRSQVGIMDYRDPKGNGPIHYTKFIKKLGITQEDVIREANRLNVELDPIHFVEPEVVIKPKQNGGDKKKGRPQKTDKVIDVDEVNDLFAEISLCGKADQPLPELTQELDITEPVVVQVNIPTGKSKAEEVSEKAKKTEEARLEKAKKAEEARLEKERKAEEKLEKARKIEEAKLEKARKIEEAKLEKEKKAATKITKTDKNIKKDNDIKQPQVVTEPVVRFETPIINNVDINVTTFEFDGVMYFKTADNLLYNAAREMVGKVTSNNDVILYDSDQESDEESEDSYDEE